MKNNCLTIGFVIGTFFCANASAADTLSLSMNAMTLVLDTMQVENKQVAVEIQKTNDPIVPTRRGTNKHNETTVNLAEEKAEEIQIPNPLLDSIINYDVFARRVYPRPARAFYPEDELEFPTMSPLFMPLVFNGIKREYKINLREKEEPSNCLNSYLLDSLRAQFASSTYTYNLTQSLLIDAESRHIGITRYDKSTLPQPENLIYFLNSRKQGSWMKNIGSVPGKNANTKDLPKTEYNPWSKKVNVKLQFSQTYNSPNWSKGGESNMAGLTTIYLESNYSNLTNIQFDNNVEAKIGLNTVSQDTLRNLNVSTDQLRAVSKLGVRMHNDFYYSLSGEFITQFLNNYRSNTMNLRASFLSPARMFVGLGVDYKKSNNKKGYSLSLLLTPLTCKFNYLYDNVNLKPTDFGIEKGRHLKSELGSKLAATLTWRLSEQVQWKSNFYYFTDFTYVDSDWENTLDLNFNNYFATSIYVHLKLDDRLKREPGAPLLQMQELFSFGMAYHW